MKAVIEPVGTGDFHFAFDEREQPRVLRVGRFSADGHVDRAVIRQNRKRFPRVGARRRARLMGRSEEHTSELQSPCNLVCRLLLEKKKKTKTYALLCTNLAHLNSHHLIMQSVILFSHKPSIT